VADKEKSSSDEAPLDCDVVTAIGREVANGVTKESSKFAPLTPAMEKEWDEYVTVFASVPAGAALEIPWSPSEKPDAETWAPHEQHMKEILAKYRAHDAIRKAKPPE
jgi:hypothetical protein